MSDAREPTPEEADSMKRAAFNADIQELRRRMTYVPPNEERAYRHNTVGAAYDDAMEWAGGDSPPTFDRVFNLFLQFGIIITGHCPGSANKSAALRCLYLARNAANEYLRTENTAHATMLQLIVAQELTKARFQANSAIALDE